MICPHCKKEIDREKMILKMCKDKEYSLNQLARELLVMPSSITPKIQKLEQEGKIKVVRNGIGKKILIKTMRAENE